MDGGQAEWTPEKQSRAIGVEQSGFKSNQRDSERIKASQPIWGRASSVMTRAVLTGTAHLTHDARSMRESFAITSARPRLGHRREARLRIFAKSSHSVPIFGSRVPTYIHEAAESYVYSFASPCWGVEGPTRTINIGRCLWCPLSSLRSIPSGRHAATLEIGTETLSSHRKAPSYSSLRPFGVTF